VAKLYTTIWAPPFRQSVSARLPPAPRVGWGAASFVVCVGISLAAAQLRLLSAGDPLAALDAAIRWGGGALVVLLFISAVRTTLRGTVEPRVSPSAEQILWITAALIGASLLRSPHRLVVNLFGLALLGVPLVWATRRLGGARAASQAAAAVAVLAFFPTHLDVRSVPERAQFNPTSAFRWAVGWPTAAWVLRHEMTLDRPLGATPVSLFVQRAGAYRGPAQIEVTLDGERVGLMAERGQDWLAIDLPTAKTTGQTHLDFELRQVGHDPQLKIVAQRWSGGATTDGAASSYFDGTAWHKGTFNTATGRAESGIYVLQLRGDVWR